MPKRTAGALLPILFTEITFSRAALAASLRNVSLREFADAALDAAIGRAEQDHRSWQYAQTCREAVTRRDITPTRHEFDQDQMPFVRRQRSASETQAGRPSSRQVQKGRDLQAGSKAAQPGPERPAATRSAASMARTREDPPFDAAENPGRPPVQSPSRNPSVRSL